MPKIPAKLAFLYVQLVARRVACGDSPEGAHAYAMSTLWKAVTKKGTKQ